MSAALPVVQAPPLMSEALCSLLGILARGARPADVVRAFAVVGPHTVVNPGEPGLAVELLPAELSSRLLPRALLDVLERSMFGWQLALGTRRSHAEVSTLAAYALTWKVRRVMRNPEKPSSPFGLKLLRDTATQDAILARVEAFLPPTAVLQSQQRVSTVWALGEALDASAPAGERQALELLHRLAAALGAERPAERLLDVSFPCPGFQPDGDDESTTRCTRLDASRVYTPDQIEAALAAAKE